MKVFSTSLCIFLSFSLIVLTCVPGCKSLPKDYSDYVLVDPHITPEAKALFVNLDQIRHDHILFGHQNTLAYGVHWKESPSSRSDVKDITGSYPAVYGWDIGKIELGSNENLDKLDFNDIRKWIREAYERGGIITISWHMDNPATGGNTWDVEDNQDTVARILPGGDLHSQYKEWLNRFALFAHSLKAYPGTDNEHIIPIVFRPFHEHTGDWFWWGADYCSPDEFKRLWQFTVEYLRDEKEVHNLLWALSPSTIDSVEQYLERYPGDDYVDILGIDDYKSYREPYDINTAVERISIIVKLAEERGKIPALTETGYEAIPDPNWWTDTLLAVLNQDAVTRRIAWLLVWRNANEGIDKPNHYYAPYPGHPSEASFLAFYDHSLILFEDDLPDMYKLPRR